MVFSSIALLKAIEILDVKVKHLDDRPQCPLVQARWTATGSVGNWGHIHIRKNPYEASITVEPVAAAWKITDLGLLEEKRIDPYANPERVNNVSEFIQLTEIKGFYYHLF